MKKLWQKIVQLPRWSLFLSIGLIFVLLLTLRSCNSSSREEYVYNIIRSQNWAPLELFGKDANMGAFVDELVGYVADNEHLRLHLTVRQQQSVIDLFKLLDLEEYDAILVTFSPSEYLKNKYLISNPIFEAGPVLVVRADNKVSSLKDLRGKAIAIKRGSKMLFQLGHETSFFVPYDNMISALDDLEKNLIAGVIMEEGLAHIYENDFYKGKIRIATPPLTDLGLRLVARKGDLEEELINKFNRGLKEAQSNDAFERLILKWNVIEK